MFNFAPFSSVSIVDFEQVNVIQEDFSKWIQFVIFKFGFFLNYCFLPDSITDFLFRFWYQAYLE